MNNYSAGKPWKIAKQQHMMETAYRLFSEKGIEAVSIPDIARASGVGRATIFRYFSTKLELVIAISTWKWEEYIDSRRSFLQHGLLEKMTAAEWLKYYFDAFLDLYRNHPDILRFNYNFNSYVKHETHSTELEKPYIEMVERLSRLFHELYCRGIKDGTLNTEIPEKTMFSISFHIMLAAATRYAIGLVYVSETEADTEKELVMLVDLFLAKFTKQS